MGVDVVVAMSVEEVAEVWATVMKSALEITVELVTVAVRESVGVDEDPIEVVDASVGLGSCSIIWAGECENTSGAAGVNISVTFCACCAEKEFI